MQKYRCLRCGQIVVPEEDGTCPVCGAPFEKLRPIEEPKKDK